jgi:hypothetical protein
MKLILLLFFALQLAFVYALYVLNARLTRLETRQPAKPEPKAAPVQTKQIFEKPVVKNAKEVKPLEIGDGRMRFDAEAQIAEWV